MLLAVAVDLTYQLEENFEYIFASFGRGFKERHIVRTGKFSPFLRGYLPVINKILHFLESKLNSMYLFVANKNERKVLLVILHTENLRPQLLSLIKAQTRCNTVNKQESVSGGHILIPQGAILILGAVSH